MSGPPTSDDVDAALARARGAARELAAMPGRDRARALGRVRRCLASAAEEIAATVVTETGKPLADVYLTELLPAQLHLRWLERHAPRVLADRRVSSWPQLTKRTRVRHVPRGVAGVISPWNYPFFLTLVPTVTAVAAGCAVVVKPAEATPRSGAWVATLAERAGLPVDTVAVVTGGPGVGAALVDGVDVISFTGSSAVGRRVAEQAGRRLVPAVLELGGNDAMVVLEDADLRRAARTAVWSAFLNAGQSCVSVERVFVAAAVHDRFLAELDDAMVDVAGHDGPRRGIGPLVSDAAADRVRARLDDAVRRGATIRHGGRVDSRAPRPFMEPTVVTGVARDDPLLHTELFGPVLSVVRADDGLDAVRGANSSPYGLSASVWGRDRDRTQAAAAVLEAGSVVVNDAMVTFGMPAVPFGGRRASGLGRLGGAEGLRAFCDTVSVTETRLALPREPQWFPRRIGARTTRALVRLLGR